MVAAINQPDSDPYDSFDPMAQFVDGVAGNVRDPYPRFRRKRPDAPVECAFQMNFAEAQVEAWTAHTYDTVSAVLRDNAGFCSGAIREMLTVVMGPYALVGMDEPEHKRLRSLVALAFRQKTLQHWDAELIVPVIDEYIDRFAARGRAELVREFTYRYPVHVIAAILGLPAGDYPFFHQRAIALLNVAANPDAGIVASIELRDYFAEVLEQRRRAPESDLISELVRAELEGEQLGDEEIFSFLRLLLPAGAETTYRATGNFLFALLTHPEQLDALRADRSLMPQAIEESLRWESPLLLTMRSAASDTEVAGITVPTGGEVHANVGSANHDETRWERAEEFDIFRDPRPHIAFGVGPHMCLGMHLARMEMASAVNRLLDRLPNLRPDPELWDRQDVHIHGENFRSPVTLPVVFDPST
jgi:cytochrome P450